MRLLHASLVVAALLAAAPASAQSAYDYPWCGVYTSGDGPGGGQSCYFATYQQCMATMDRLGICTQSPYYRGPVNDAVRRRPHRGY
jgi:Protein of unknown function (DUF3551)